MVSPDPADILLQLGDSANLSLSAFQLGNDEILVVTQPQTGVGTLAVDQVRGIYSGQITNWNEVGGSNLPIEVWTYSSGEDIRQIFDQEVLKGLQVIPAARVAVSAQQMSDSVGTNPGAIGFLPRRWKTGNTHETHLVIKTPVMAYTKSEPIDNLEKVLACLQL
jgi:ABC-type phosphate transport system substrate-binding protein